MSGNYVRKLGKEVFKSAGLLNLQRIYMNNCHVQVRLRKSSLFQNLIRKSFEELIIAIKPLILVLVADFSH